MRSLIRASVRFRLIVVALAAGVLALGAVTLRDAPVDVLPEFAPPYAEIQTEALGLSATEVENLITVPLEADLLNGVEGVDVIRSESLPGLSSIVLVFEPGTDVYRARQLVQERLAQAHALPRVSKPPTLLQPLSASSRVLIVGLSSDRVSPIELSVIARWTVRPRLMGVPGVANVAVWGMRDQQIQVLVDPEELRDRDVTLDQVVRTAGNAQIVSPLSFLEASTPGSGGFIETPQQRLQVRNVLERLADPDALGSVPVERTGSRLRLRDVADVAIGHQPLIGDAVVGGGDGLLLVIEKFPGANTSAVTGGVEDALETLRPGLSGIATDTSVFRPASYIEQAIDNLALALVAGAALAALALALLLFQWRAVLIVLVSVPVSLVAAALVLDRLGETFNAISLAGLAAALAIVVDDAVAGAESIARRVREDPRPGALEDVVAGATDELRGPLTYATAIALTAIVPIVIIEGRPGAFFEPLALAYALAAVAATIVALTVTPVLGVVLFARGARQRRESPLLRRLRPRYDGALARVLRRPRRVLLAAGAVTALALALLPLGGTSLIPEFEDRDVLIHLEGEPGTSNPRMTEIATAVGRELRAVPGVESAGAHVGRAVTGDQRVDVNSGDVWVGVSPDADYEATVRRIEAVVARVPGVERDVASYSAQRMRDVGSLATVDGEGGADGLGILTGSDAPLVARVYGHDLPDLEREAERVRRVMAQVDGVDEPRVELPAEQPNLVIEVDLERAHRFGMTPGHVRRAEATLVQGINVGSVFDDQKVFDVIVQGKADTRQTPAAVRDLLIDTPDGGHVRLGQVADVRVEPTPVAIRREAVSRFVDVEAGVGGRDVADAAAELRGRLADVAFPLEYHAEVLEETAHEEIGAAAVLAVAVVAALAAFLLLQAAFQSWRLAVAALALLPPALSGGVLAALAGTGELALGSLIGLLALLALAVRVGIAAIRRLQQLEWAEGWAPGPALVRHGAQDRLTPVMATSTALALLVLPFVALGSRAGLEIVHPLAVAVLGGVVTTALVALFAVPAAYLRYGAGAAAPAIEDAAPIVRQYKPDEVTSAGGPNG